MNEKDIQRIENELLNKYVTAPLDLEAEIESLSREVSNKLVLGTKESVSFQFLGDEFIIRAKVTMKNGRRTIIMVVSNETTRELAGNKYIPFTVESEVDNNFSTLENYKAIIEAFLKHVSNSERPEILDDDD